jgi:hypothetical protein
MYHLLRRLHLFTGLLLLVFVLMYFVSGYVMIHPEWFGERVSTDTTRSEVLSLPPKISDSELPAYLEKSLGLRGQSGKPEHRKDGSTRLNFVRPGTTFQTEISPGGKEITITQKQFGFTGLANGLHRLHGYRGGWAYWLWSLCYDLASLALIVFGLTGIVLWYQSTSKHMAGWLCLVASFGFTGAMILYLMLSK